MTNYEKIKSMSIEETKLWLKNTIVFCFGCVNKTHKDCPLINFCFNRDENMNCADRLIEWLENEVIEDE